MQLEEGTECFGDREITDENGDCTTCLPYTRAQQDNSVCLSDECGDNQIITWLGTCADCEDGTRPDSNRGTCVGPSGLRLNALMEEPIEDEASSTHAAKKRSFPTILVAGLGTLIAILSAAAAVFYYKNNQKPAQPPTIVE